MLILANLKRLRQSKGLRPREMSSATKIGPARYGYLELHTGKITEPWFREAVSIARVLGCSTITQLVRGRDVGGAAINAGAELGGKDMPTDHDLWRSGIEMDLSTAYRVSRSFGLADPLHLIDIPHKLLTEIWSVVATGERVLALDDRRVCPWCVQEIVGDAGHLPTCLPNNLLAPRGRQYAPNVSFSPSPRQAGGTWGTAGVAHGLKRIRESRKLTQREMGALFGVPADHYSKMERGAVNLPISRAECLANKIGCDVAAIYHL